MIESQPAQKRRCTVAVIAVHGVGDQQPFETARKIGDLLQDLSESPSTPTTQPPPPCAEPGPERPGYYPFHEDKIRINVNPVVVRPTDSAPQVSPSKRASTLGPFNAWVKSELGKKKARWRTTPDIRQQQPARSYDIFVEFMKRQLFCYAGDKPEDTYETIRLEGTRAPRTGSPEIDVHIYELYWADLSRLKAGIFSIFTELYQLLFHLSSLGVHAVNAASLDHPEESQWRWFRRLQSWSSGVLTVPLPVLNLLMLGLLGVILGLGALGSMSPQMQLGIIVAGFTAELVVLTGIALWRWMKTHTVPRAGWMIAFAGWLVVAGVFIYALGSCVPLQSEHRDQYQSLFHVLESILLFPVMAGVWGLVIRAYNRRRPGVLLSGSLLCGVVLLAGVPTFCRLHTALQPFHLASTVPQFWVREFEVAYWTATASWLLFFALALLNCIFGLLAVIGSAGEKRDLAVRSRWTGWLMLSLPSFIFLSVTVIAWGLLAKAAEKMFPIDPYYPLLSFIRASCPRELAGAFLSGPVEVMLPVALFSSGIAALPAIWGLAPIAWSEVFPPPVFKALRRSQSHPVGQWLTLAYRPALLISGLLIYLLMIVLVPGGAVLRFFGIQAPAIKYLGVLSGALFGWLFLARGSLKKLALGFRPALDLLLDVDNWLREHPLNGNPKARICGRYISLLRYICNWKNPDNPDGYEKLVVIAHSQGTVITADLLRFLHSPMDSSSSETWRDLDPQLLRLGRGSLKGGLPITFFTMGCPLRQLYSLRFPYLYRWARHQISSTMLPFVQNDLQQFVPLPDPNPQEFGVERWVNAYRSGDYVGRQLWRTDGCGYLWWADPRPTPGQPPLPGSNDAGGTRQEFCIGAGAHTHYWDETAPAIAQELDFLIGD